MSKTSAQYTLLIRPVEPGLHEQIRATPSVASRSTSTRHELTRTPPPTCSAASLKRKRTSEPETADSACAPSTLHARVTIRAAHRAPPRRHVACWRTKTRHLRASDAHLLPGVCFRPCASAPGSREKTATLDRVFPPTVSGSAESWILRALE